MKRLFAFILTAAVLFSCLAFGMTAEDYEPREYTIPMLDTAPNIDGILGNEWSGAYHKYIGMTDPESYDRIDWNTGVKKEEACPGWDIWMGWLPGDDEKVYWFDEFDEGGLYIAVSCKDISRNMPYRIQGTASTVTDEIQVAIDPLFTGSKADAFMFDFSPYSALDENNTGTILEEATVYEHYIHGTDPREYYYLLCESNVTEEGYTMEIFIPWMCMNLTKNDEPTIPDRVAGTQMAIGLILHDWVGASYYYYCLDFGLGDSIVECADWPICYNIVTLGDKLQYLKGDVDLSKGTPTIADALTLFKHVAGTQLITDAVALGVADVDDTVGITISDALLLFKYVAGIIESL